MTRPTLTVGLANYGSLFAPAEWYRFVDLARAADDAGIDRIVVVDHVVMGPHTENYVWGKFPVPPEAPWFEPLIVLAAIASATSRVRLATGILIAPLRPAVLLAKQAATLDVLSRGRLDLGVGTGWQREEYDAEGVDFAQRGAVAQRHARRVQGVVARHAGRARHADALVPRRVLRAEAAAGRAACRCGSAGTLHARNLERLVRWGDAWIPIMGATLDDIADGRAPHRRSVARRRPRSRRRSRCRRRSGSRRGDDGRPDLARSMAVGARPRRGRRDRRARDAARLQRRPGRRARGARRDRRAASTDAAVARRAPGYRLDRADSFRRLSDPPDRRCRSRIPRAVDPNHYDRFWFNGYTEDFYFAAGMAVYPNRGIIDGAFAVVHDGVQRSVFASGRIPAGSRRRRASGR